MFLREVMVVSIKTREVFTSILLRWNVCSVDAEGLSRGMVLSWNPMMVNFEAYFSVAYIFLHGYV